MEKQEQQTEFEPCWALVEIFGHQRFAGKISEQAIAGDKLVRIDVPPLPERRITAMSRYHPISGERPPDGQVWQYTSVQAAMAGYPKLFGVKAIYALTPMAESTVRALLDKERPSHAEGVEAVPDPAIAAIAPPDDGAADDKSRPHPLRCPNCSKPTQFGELCEDCLDGDEEEFV